MKAKLILLVISTILIGFILGILTSAQLRLHKLRPVRVYFSEGRFREGFYRTIQPDEKQKAVIDEILDRYAKINSETQARFRKELESNIRAFRKELEPKLTKEQLARLKEMDERREEMMRQDRRKFRPDTNNFRNDRRNGPGRMRDFDAPPPSRYPRRDTVRSTDGEQ